MASIESMALPFLSLAKCREASEPHGFSIELAVYIGKINLPVFITLSFKAMIWSGLGLWCLTPLISWRSVLLVEETGGKPVTNVIT